MAVTSKYQPRTVKAVDESDKGDSEQVVEFSTADIDDPTKSVITARNTRTFIYTEERQHLVDAQKKLQDQIDNLDANCGPNAKGATNVPKAGSPGPRNTP